jgi:hypothetical protein
MLAAAKIPYRYTKTELNQLLKSMVVLIDTREKKADHIIKYLNKSNVPHKSKALDYGDYSLMLPANKMFDVMDGEGLEKAIKKVRKAAHCNEQQTA